MVLACGLVSGRAIGQTPAGRVEALEFLSDHNLICRNTDDLLSGGERYPAVEWSRTPPRNAPITHTAGATARIKARLRLSLDLARLPAEGKWILEGVSPEKALCFRREGSLPLEATSDIEVEASEPLGQAVRKLQQPIRWQLSLPDSKKPALELGQTGPHTIYTTLGIPRLTDDPVCQVTDVRMELVVRRVGRAQAAVGLDASPPRLVNELVKQSSKTYQPTRHYSRDRAWKVPESWTMNPPGASCIAIVDFVTLLCNMSGMEGEAAMTAFHALPDKPARALRGGLGDKPQFKRSPGGQQWQLFLVDDSNSADGQPDGRGGMNFYQAALQYEWKGGTYYFPGGTGRVYDDPDQVLKLFRTLAWARYDAQLREWVVMEVVHNYCRRNERRPASVTLP